MNPTLSVVNAAHETATHDYPLRDLLAGISDGRWANKVEQVREAYDFGGKEGAAKPKRELPAILFSGTFSRRATDGLVQHSGLICADLDELGSAVASTKEQISADPHVLAAFVSPTGAGLKAVFRCDPAKPHKESFHALEHYVAEHFGLRIDQKCSDVSRMCFVSHDPEMFVAEDAECIPYPSTEPEKPYAPKPVVPGSDLTPGDDYNLRGGDEVPALLESHGWQHSHGKYWIRPGKSSGISASWGFYPNTLHVFSDSPETGLPSDQKGFDPFAIYTHLEHHGDWKAAAKALAARGYGTPAKSRQQQNLERIAGTNAPATALPLKPLFSFTIPPNNDDSIILGNRYLNKGDGLVISSTSGMGKSALAIQMAARWSLGMDAFGIRPARPLRILIIQAEDSDGDIAEVTASIAHVMKLTAEQQATISERVKVVTDRVNRGHKFLASLKTLIDSHRPDFVIINPLQAFVDGDITASKDLGAFLREGLNALNEPPKFAYGLVHHTTKPATGKDRSERQWHEVMYDMAGGAEIINWARAIMSLRATPKEGEFNLVLAKRGRRAGVTKEVPHGVGTRQEPVTIIPLKHASGHLPSGQPIIYWETRDTPDESATPAKKGGGRPITHLFETYRTVFPPKSSKGATINELARLCSTNKPIKANTLHDVAQRWANDGDVEIIRGVGQPDRYRAAT